MPKETQTSVNPHHNFKGDSNKFSNTQIIYDDGEFVVAKGLWEGKHPSVGCRWYSRGIGYPQTHGIPTWMIMSKEIGDILEFSLVFTKNIIDIPKRKHK
jgi:hypothetical protein